MQRTRSFTTSFPARAHPVPRIAHADNTMDQSYHCRMHTHLPARCRLPRCMWSRATRGRTHVPHPALWRL
jgi:hypothetical protein